MHVTTDHLRAYLDRELSAPEEVRVQSHLAVCERCRREAEMLSTRATFVRERLALLAPRASESAPPAAVARARLSVRSSAFRKEIRPLLTRLFSRQYRARWAALMATLAVAVALAFPPVRALAVDFLGLFRVQRVAVVPVNPADLPEVMGSSVQLEQMLAQDVQVEEEGAPQEAVNAQDAAAAVGFPVRLLATSAPQRLTVHPRTRITFVVDLLRVRAILNEMGRTDIRLPDELDGATVVADVPRSVTATYGDCPLGEGQTEAAETGGDRDCTILIQLASPTITAPPGLDVEMIGEAFLQLLGMTPEEAARFSRTVDWSTTLVIPIPRYGSTYEDVQVDGVTGTLIVKDDGEHPASYMLLWLKDGVLYALSGPGGRSTALDLVGSIR